MNIKGFITSLIIFLSSNYYAQLLQGDLINDNRKIKFEESFVIKPSNYDGKILFKISVNAEGNITSAEVIEERSTIISTPARLKAKKQIFNIKFEPGTYFPKNHTGIYQIIYKKN